MNVYEIVTDKIIHLLEKGVIPWHMPWHVEMPMNLVSKKQYRGINALLLSHTGFKSPYWLTYNQAQLLKGHIKKNSKGMPVVFWHMVKGKPESTSDDAKVFPLLRYFTVFNVEQCGGIPIPESGKIEFNPIDECEALINAMPQKPVIHYGGNKASYSKSQDLIRMPHKDDFKSIESYYATLFHEAVHSTGHENRLNRASIAEPHAFGSETYSKEELIAEMGASFLCSHTGIENMTIENQAGYIGHWLQRLQDDKKLIISAASQAQKACDFILNRNQEDDKPCEK